MSQLSEVTDPGILAQLNGEHSQQEVTDPAILAQLNTPQSSAETPSNSAPSVSTAPVGGFFQNAYQGAKEAYDNAALGIAQMYSKALEPDIAPQLEKQAEAQQQKYAPLNQTVGGKVGQIGAWAPLALVPGANTYAGAALLGGGLGALNPTTEGDSRLANTAIGALTGLGGKYVGDALPKWLTSRAAQPFMGWNLKTGAKAAAQAVGSDAPKLDQPAIAAASRRFDQIFGAARSPDVSIPVGDSTLSALDKAGGELNTSSRAAMLANDQVKDLISHLGSNPTAEQLGDISSKLGNEASSQMSSKSGDRALGKALYAVKDHVDDLIGGSISDPNLKSAYNAARPQYRTFMTLTKRPTLLNSTTGMPNLRNLGNYLQRYDKAGFTEGKNTSPLYQAARWGQMTRQGNAPPSLLQPMKAAMFYGINNPVTGALGGTVSRALAPAAPAISYGLPRLSLAGTPLLTSQFAQ